MAAARLAGLDALFYHTFSADASVAYQDGQRALNQKLAAQPEGVTVAAFVEWAQSLGYEWGESDGN